MENIIQLLIKRGIPYNIRNVSTDDQDQVFIYIRDNKGETLFRVSMSFTRGLEYAEYSWYDLREDSMIEIVDIPKEEIIGRIKQINIEEIYKIES